MDNKQIIYEILSDLKGRIQENMKRADAIATKKTYNSLEIITDENSGQLLAASHIDELETGHPPVKDGGKRLSFKTDFQSIKDWMDARGVKMNISTLISRLNANGSHLYQVKGFRNIYSNDINDPSFIEKVQNELSNNFLVRVNKDIEKYIKI